MMKDPAPELGEPSGPGSIKARFNYLIGRYNYTRRGMKERDVE